VEELVALKCCAGIQNVVERFFVVSA